MTNPRSKSAEALTKQILQSDTFVKAAETVLEGITQVTTAAFLGFFSHPDIQLITFTGELPKNPLVKTSKLLKNPVIKKMQVAVPLVYDKKIIGVLELSWDVPPPPEEVDAVEKLCSQIAPVLGVIKENEMLTQTLKEELTKRKKVEEALQECEKEYKDVFEKTPIGIYRTTPEGRILRANPALIHMLGYSSFEELAQRNLEKEGFKAGYPRTIFKESIERDGQITGFETGWIRRDGTTVLFLENARAVRDEAGNTLYYEGTVEDITERKQAEEQLKESEKKYRNIVELAPDGILTMDVKGTITSCNTAFSALTGFSKEEIVGKHFTRTPTLRKRDIPRYVKIFGSVLRGTVPQPIEFTWMHKNGSLRLGEIHTSVMRKEGKITGFQVIARDITERKQAEEKMRESEEMYRTMVELAPDSIITMDLKGVITSCNTATATLTGYAKEDIVSRHISQLTFLRVEDIPLYLKLLTSIVKGKEPVIPEVHWLHKDGTRHVAEISARLIKEGRKPLGILAIARDITERQHAEKLLQQSEEQYRTLVENLNVGVYRSAPGEEGHFIDVNTAFVTMLGYRKEEMLTLKASDIYVNPEDRKKFNEKVSSQGFVKNEELHLKRKDGTPIIISDTATAVYNTDGSVLYFDGISEDITERKRVEEQIKQSLKEKEVLLQEIHHRVKNNMQIISSLLNLQSRSITDNYMRTMFKESQNRIQSMALIHEKLYKSTDLASIDFKEYITGLVDSLTRSYYDVRGRVGVTMDVEDVFLGVDHAIPCGLIVNELVSNALKHAFPGERKGEITISLHKHDDTVDLAVSDNGVGIPEDIDFQSTQSLGLRLVIILAEDQLNGEVTLDRTEGTEVRFTFRVAQEEL